MTNILTREYRENFILDFVKRTQDLEGMNNWARMAKVMEELGEAGQALILHEKLNPRKTDQDVRIYDIAMEYGDVVMTALVAIVALGFDPETVLQEQRRKTEERLWPHDPS